MDERTGSFANWTNGFSSCTDTFLDHEASYTCCSTNPGTSCVFVSRHSPRLLMNGYYVLTEDSVLSDEMGNVTLSLSQTSVTYKEKLIRIFRKRKRIRRSLDSLFSLSASDSWMNRTACSDRNAHFVDDSWLERGSEMGASHHDNGTTGVAFGPKAQPEEKHSPAPNAASSSKDTSKESKAREESSPYTCLLTEEDFHEQSLGCSKSCTVRKGICQTLMLSMGFILSLSARFFLGGLLTTLLSCLLLFLLIRKLSA
ncbi:transmembrane protein 71 [Paroedura picta]|uniref:transmembrane protein 71 n=1 Tax=Paroedura picta TaxID=143630 RepID=UPI0040565878